MDFEFASDIKGGSVPKEYIPGVQKGIESVLGQGVIAGYPVLGMKATLIDGAYHDVDSSVMAFEIAGRAATREGLRKAKARLMEPLMQVDVSTPEEYMGGTANWRTDLYATRGTLMTHAESIELFKELGVKFTPELKSAKVEMPYEGEFSQQDYAQKLIEEYKTAGVAPNDVFPQSFSMDDVLYWIEQEPEFGKQAVYLDGRTYRPSFRSSLEDMQELAEQGVRILAPPIYALLDLDGGKIVPSTYARQARQAGIDLITWTLERSGPLTGGGGWYYQTVKEVINNDGVMMQVLDVLAQQIGVIGVFSDWPATTTYYANCMNLP